MSSRSAVARLLGVSLACATTFALLGPAHANGRFPAAFQLVEAPGDPDHLLVQVTYGFVSTRDRGATWAWTCEKAIGFVGDIDPPIAIAEGGVSLAALFDGVVRASPDGCNWGFVAGPTEGRFTIDVSVTRSDPREVVALTSDGLGNDRFDTRLFRSVDAGATFTLASAFPEDFIAETVDVAPSDPSRVYVTGFFALGEGVYAGAFGRSDDGGATFELSAIEGSDNGSGPFLAAVHPTDPDVLFVRLGGLGGRLLRSGDGGTTFDGIFDAEGSLQGFALSPDGSTILVGGEGDPIHRGSSEGGGFEVVSQVRPKCLSWFESGVYACGSETAEGFTIGVSQDQGETFAPLYSRYCTPGPLDCPAGTPVGDECDAEWVKTRPTIGADQCPDTTATVGAGGAGATSTSVGAPGATAGAGGDAAGEGESGGCCTVAPGASRPGRDVALAAALLGLALAGLRRRRGRG